MTMRGQLNLNEPARILHSEHMQVGLHVMIPGFFLGVLNPQDTRQGFEPLLELQGRTDGQAR